MPKLPQSKKYHTAWAMYDWANSAYNLVITSTIFPAYYESVTTIRRQGVVVQDTVDFFGREIKNSALFEYALAFAYLVIALISPILSSIADYTGNKKVFMGFFAVMGAMACMLLYFFTQDNVSWAIVLFGIAALGYCGSLVFYNAYLPEIASYEQRDKLSAKGFSLGYIGSVLLQVACLVFVLNDHWFADKTFPARLSFLMVGIWWIGFALIPLIRLPKGKAQVHVHNRNFITGGFQELKEVWKQVRKMPVLELFLTAFFFYSIGVQTVMLAASMFGSKELKLATDQLIITILLIQLVAIVGAYLMARLSALWGNMKVLLLAVIIWVGICIAAYFIHNAVQFYLLGALVGLVMGGIQSLSRSTYSKLMPETQDTASFFSFYDVVEKIAIVIGMFTFAIIDEHFGMRQSVVALMIFFLLGAAMLIITLKKQKRITV